MIRPPENTKQLCERLVSCWKVEGDINSLQLIQALIGAHFEENRQSPEPKEPSDIRRLGIWERKTIEGESYFVRQTGKDPEYFWSGTEQIRCRHEKMRVILLGESVARGYYYEPEFTPALALQHMLNTVAENIEVIDLSRIAIGLRELLDLVVSCRCLCPDAVVIMAGNNWHPLLNNVWRPGNSRDVAAILRNNGTGVQVSQYIGEVLDRATRVFIQTVGAVAQGGIPVVYLLPESNLVDWRVPQVVAPFLPHKEMRQWLTARECACEALRQGDIEKLVAEATAMLELDKGTHPSAFYFLADAQKTTGGTQSEMRSLLMRARDATLIAPTERHCYTRAREIIRGEASSQGITLIDLPHCLEEYLQGEAPGRRMFLDYCHFTTEGIQLAMAKLAEHLLPLLGTRSRSWAALLDQGITVRPEINARAHLLAAIVNSQKSQSTEVIKFHLQQALNFMPGACGVLTSLLDAKVQNIPSMLCPGIFEQFAQFEERKEATMSEYLSTTSAARLLQYFPERIVDRIELSFIDALAESLTPGNSNVAAQAAEQLREYHGIASMKRSLLESTYIDSPLVEERRWMELGATAFFRAFAKESKFVLPWNGVGDLALAITYRCSARHSEDEMVRALINGVEVSCFVPKSQWQTVRLNVPCSMLERGVNRLTLEWPCPDDAQIAAHRATQINALECEKAVQPALGYGEVYELAVQSARITSENAGNDVYGEVLADARNGSFQGRESVEMDKASL